MASAVRIAIGMGGNIGDTPALFQQAILLLEQGGLQKIRKASDYRTAPVDCVPGTPDFCNSALTAEWQGTPLELLELTQRIERALGRPAVHNSRESRTLDLDILLIERKHICHPRLTVPHPRMYQRDFVRLPLQELLGEKLEF